MEVGPSAPPMMAMAAATCAREAEHQRQQECGKDAELCRCTQQQRGRARDQRAEVGHGTDTEEDDGRINRMLDALIEHPQHTGTGTVNRCVEQAGQRQVGQQHAECDRNEQQRLKLFADTHVQQHACNDDHDQAARVLRKGREARACQNAA